MHSRARPGRALGSGVALTLLTWFAIAGGAGAAQDAAIDVRGGTRKPVAAAAGAVLPVGTPVTAPCGGSGTRKTFSFFLRVNDDGEERHDIRHRVVPPSCRAVKLKVPGRYLVATRSGRRSSKGNAFRIVAKDQASVVTRGDVARLELELPASIRVEQSRWRFELTRACGPYEKGKSLPDIAKKGRSLSFRIPCPVAAEVTARDSRRFSYEARMVVEVRARTGREWRTPTKYEVFDTVFPLPGIFAPPLTGLDKWNLGANLCPDGRNDLLFCRGATPWHELYATATIADPDSPFDGWSYTTSSTIALERAAFLNPHWQPGAPPIAPGQPNWYQYNAARGVNVAAAIAFVEKHEGYGIGAPRSGHMQAAEEALQATQRHNDPRRYIESRVDSELTRLHADATTCLDRIDSVAFHYSQDPLVGVTRMATIIPRHFVWFDSPVLGTWVEQQWPRLKTGSATPAPMIECAGAP